MPPPPRDLLLVTPSVRAGESLRGFTLRVALANGDGALFREHFETLRHCTAMAIRLERLAGVSRADLWRRVSYRKVGQQAVVRIGDELFGTSVARLSRRSVCPLCVGEGWSSRCVWELHVYKVCHVHNTPLVSRCDGVPETSLGAVSCRRVVCVGARSKKFPLVGRRCGSAS